MPRDMFSYPNNLKWEAKASNLKREIDKTEILSHAKKYGKKGKLRLDAEKFISEKKAEYSRRWRDFPLLFFQYLGT